jgi:hypothetical protein
MKASANRSRDSGTNQEVIMTELNKEQPARRQKKASIAKAKSDAVKRVNIGVSVDDMIWRRLRGLAIREGKLTGELLDRAIADYLEKHEQGA